MKMLDGHQTWLRVDSLGRASAVVAVALGVTAATAVGNITIQGPTNHLASINLDMTGHPVGSSGTSTLKPDPVVYLAPPAANSPFMLTFAGDVAQYPGWTAVQGAALNGTMQIVDYLATAPGARKGGARMVATYTPAGGENGAILRWVQMFNTTLSGMHIDPFPNDDEGAPGAADDLPFYYTEAEHATHGLTFEDNPEVGPIPTMFSYNATFSLHLVSANFLTKVVTVHDGFRWGYNVMSVPGPASAAALALLFGLGGRRRRQSSL